MANTLYKEKSIKKHDKGLLLASRVQWIDLFITTSFKVKTITDRTLVRSVNVSIYAKKSIKR